MAKQWVKTELKSEFDELESLMREAKTAGKAVLLSNDGGGMAGLFPLVCADEMETRLDGPLCDYVTMVVGRSIGAAGATMIMHAQKKGEGPAKARTLLFDHLTQVFKVRKDKNGQDSKFFGQYDISPITGPGGALVEALGIGDDDMLPDPTPYDVNEGSGSQTPFCFLITATASRQNGVYQPKLLSNFKLGNNHHWSAHVMRSWPVRIAIQASTATPDYFLPVDHGGKEYLDGAVAANNPTELMILIFLELVKAEPTKLSDIVASGLRD